MISICLSMKKSSNVFSVSFPDEMIAYIRAACFRRQCSRSEYFRQLVEKDMKECDAETKKALSIFGIEIGPQQ